MIEEELLTINDLCKRWKIHRRTLSRWGKSGKVPLPFNINRSESRPDYRYKLSDIVKYEDKITDPYY